MSSSWAPTPRTKARITNRRSSWSKSPIEIVLLSITAHRHGVDKVGPERRGEVVPGPDGSVGGVGHDVNV